MILTTVGHRIGFICGYFNGNKLNKQSVLDVTTTTTTTATARATTTATTTAILAFLTS